LLSAAARHEKARQYLSDPVFARYLQNMVPVVVAKGYNGTRMAFFDTQDALLNHIATEYELMKQAGLSSKVITEHGHKYPVFELVIRGFSDQIGVLRQRAVGITARGGG
jgi:hypothetical protein